MSEDEDARGGQGADVSSIRELIRIMEQQSEAIKNQNNQLKVLELERQQDRLRIEQLRLTNSNELQVKAAAVSAIALAGGIYGYQNGRILSPDEVEFQRLIMGFGINKHTADEVFRQGITGTNDMKLLTNEKIKSIMYNITRNKSPECPEPGKVFLGAAFEDKMSILVSWLSFQRVIGASSSAAEWNADAFAGVKTAERIQYYREVKESKGTEDLTLPEPLGDMRKFREFEDHLKSYLRTKRGAANIPLVYVIRDIDLSTVTNVERNGTVGSGPTDAYKNWDEYSIRCTALAGTHWESDNTSFWQVLSRLVRDGPGWDYIRHYEKSGEGDGRAAFWALHAQAYQFSSRRIIKNEARKALRNLRFDGPSRGWNFDKYVRAWYKNLDIIRKYGTVPDQEDIVQDFCNNIGDPRLTHGISNVLVEGSKYVKDFDKAQMYLTNSLATEITRDQGLKSNKRMISSANTPEPAAANSYDGPIEAKSYASNVWHSMSSAQKDKVRELRKQAYESKNEPKNKRNLSAANITDEEEPSKDAGNQFGATAHDSKRKKTTEV